MRRFALSKTGQSGKIQVKVFWLASIILSIVLSILLTIILNVVF